ncbi:MAG: fatty-acid synthase [Anaerolineae bacterium]|nr:fatty-acid synthase [Anaerolineae bacterium]
MRKDTHHDAVLRALQKDGWRIVDEQSPFTIEQRTVYIDIEAERNDERRLIFVEVKGFQSDSQVTDLANALGQYLLYAHLLEQEYGNTRLLYLAVPNDAYMGILSEELGIGIRAKYGVKLIVVDLEREEISQWIP